MGAQLRVSGGKPGPLCGQRENKTPDGCTCLAQPSPPHTLLTRLASTEIEGQPVSELILALD